MTNASLTPPSSDRTTPGEGPFTVTAKTVTELQSLRDYPCISILASTRPGATMHGRDVAMLRSLVGLARQRLAAEGIDETARLIDPLHSMITEAVGRPADRAIALFASGAYCRWVSLPVPVVDRCVIDPTFATRDLVRALHHTPRHAVLLLSVDEARLLHGHGAALNAASNRAFPMNRRTTGKKRGRTAERPKDFLRRVDRALGAALRLNPMPLVLAAAEPTGATFRSLSRNTSRLAGTVKGNHLTTPADALLALVRPVLRDYLKSRTQEAIALVELRARTGRVLRDIDSAWLAARWERPEMLAVEDDYYYPARLGADGDTLIPADDVDHPDVVDDVVDELIEVVLSRGGWIALLPPGELPDGTHLAMTLRRHR